VEHVPDPTRTRGYGYTRSPLLDTLLILPSHYGRTRAMGQHRIGLSVSRSISRPRRPWWYSMERQNMSITEYPANNSAVYIYLVLDVCTSSC